MGRSLDRRKNPSPVVFLVLWRKVDDRASAQVPRAPLVVEPFYGSAGYPTRVPDHDVVLGERARHANRELVSVQRNAAIVTPAEPLRPDALPVIQGLHDGTAATVGVQDA